MRFLNFYNQVKKKKPFKIFPIYHSHIDSLNIPTPAFCSEIALLKCSNGSALSASSAHCSPILLPFLHIHVQICHLYLPISIQNPALLFFSTPTLQCRRSPSTASPSDHQPPPSPIALSTERFAPRCSFLTSN